MEQKSSERNIKEIEDNGKKYKIEYLGERLDRNFKTKKVIIIGLNCVGKTTISFHLLKGEFINCAPTISLDLANYQMKVNDEIIQIQFWDTCGNEEFVEQTPNLFNDTFLAIIVYAINNKRSFEDVGTWYNILREKCLGSLVYLIGNKCDLEEERKIQKYEGEELKNQYNFNYFMETSAKTGSNIINLLDKIAINIYEKIKVEEEIYNKKNEGRFSLKKEDLDNKMKSKKKKIFC